MPYLQREKDVFILQFGEEGRPGTENRFNPDWLAQVHTLLDEVVAHDGPTALVTTAEGKFYSTGADLEWAAANPDKINLCLDEIHRILARILTLEVPTVAAMQGHTFGAGAFLAIAHDRRVMRSDRGYFCLPGITIGARYTPGPLALVSARLDPVAAHELLVTGRRYGGSEALAAGLVDDTTTEGELLSSAVDYAQSLAGTRGPVLAEIKRGLYERVLATLALPATGYNS
ncbi:enoyl-CoA hydratase/isomerase family protein [Antrihabitans cavernicola]|uniref:Enoyl-CoA hydratase/isomerase family protein n=1 Tax=Antrihabitans cavernicola TaxID=2495913 RepID=A0A5A7S8E8_9NOCA|nr:enoyl-CoA hydratase/isomerase family protein [Spelaeibacter cavernicola]KAA0020154.1 enoyl-CoA hydratase/isomerase family protein [Spelaeibacter cavernicola]